MKLKQVFLMLKEFGENEGEYIGSVVFADPERKIELNLTPEMSRRVLEACGQELLDASQILSQKLKEASATALLSRPEAVNDPT